MRYIGTYSESIRRRGHESWKIPVVFLGVERVYIYHRFMMGDEVYWKRKDDYLNVNPKRVKEFERLRNEWIEKRIKFKKI